MRAWWLVLILMSVATTAAAVEEPLPPAAEPLADAAAAPEVAPAVAAPVAETVVEPIISPPPVAPATPEDAVRAALNGTSWDVEVAPMGGDGKRSKDTLSFADGQVSSASLAKAGYAGTNYSLTIREDGTASWETMQSQEGKGIVFWRGELGGATMRGVMSKRPVEGPTEDYGFSGPETTGKTIDVLSLIGSVPAAGTGGAVKKQAAPAAPAAATPAAPDAPAPKKQKKGWF